MFYITGDSAFVVDAGLDKSKQWAPDAIPVTKEDIYPINLKGEQEYQFKITLDGTWATAKGFDDLKHQEDFPGPYRADKDNIAFKLTEDAEVRIKYNEGDFKIESEKFFVETVEPTAKFFITGDAALVGEDKAWKADAIAVEEDSYTFKALPVLEHKEDYAIPVDIWDACKSDEPKPEGKTAYGVKFTPDGAEVSLCGAVLPKDGAARISLIERRPTGSGTQWLADWLNERYNKASCVVIDGRNGVDVLIDKIHRSILHDWNRRSGS